eukprot:6179850-Pleurochrysis_carterae.AAC.2
MYPLQLVELLRPERHAANGDGESPRRGHRHRVDHTHMRTAVRSVEHAVIAVREAPAFDKSPRQGVGPQHLEGLRIAHHCKSLSP